jgi:hypothetical protein
MTEPADPLFPPRIVSQALGIPGGTLSTWAKRGWMTNFDAAFAEGRGRPRMFTLPDVLALALIKFASDNGTTQPEIISFAPDAAESFINHPDQISHLIVRWYRDSVSIRYNDDIMTEPAEPDAELTVTFNLRAIFGEATRAIKAVAKTADLERETRIEEINPSLPKISRVWQPE